MREPLVSVIMTVYNAEEYLRDAIESVLNQTFKNYEFIIVDDGSTDRSKKIIQSYGDSRIKLISHKNQGVSLSCNKAIKIAVGKYIARHDADDISIKDRFKKQVQYLELNPNVGLLGTNYELMDISGKVFRKTNIFTAPSDLKLANVFSNQFGQGTVMIRSSVLKQAGDYDHHYRITHDYDLWARISHCSDISNLKEPLYRWRYHDNSLSSSPKNLEETKREAYEIRNREFDYFRKNKSEYKLASFAPLSTYGGVFKYLEMKNAMFRNMSLMYCYSGLRRVALPILFAAVLYAPWNKKTYKQLFVILLKRNKVPELPYEFL